MLSITAAKVSCHCAAFLRSAKNLHNFSKISRFIWRITSLRTRGHAHRRLSLSSLAPGHHPVDHSVRQGIPGGHPADAGADASSEAGVLFEFSHGEVVFNYFEFLKDVFLSKPAASSFSISVRWSGISLS